MRKALVEALVSLARNDPRIVLLTGDLGYSVIEPFQEEFPDRFYNVGVAEQNMVGISTGLAESGLIPYVYSIVTFATLRPYEFIRNGPILHQLPVRIIGVGGGFDYGTAGPTHHGLEDVGIFRHYPGMDIFTPADGEQLQTIMQKNWENPGPAYYRVGKFDDLKVPGLGGRYEPGQLDTVIQGTDVLILTMGGIAVEAVSAADQLRELGISAQVSLVSQMNPMPGEAILESLADFTQVCTVEAHFITGGLGSGVAEIIAESGHYCRLKRFGIGTMGAGKTGGYRYLLSRSGLDADSLCSEIAAWVRTVS